jgi:hypothetical protein
VSLWAEPPTGSLFAEEQFFPEVDPSYSGPRVYAPRRPQQTVLYKLVQDNLEAWLATRREACPDDDPIAAHVEKAFRDYLLCGIWGAGLVKYACPDGCPEAVFVALSCRTRGLCPSCGAKHMVKTALQLEATVLPQVAHRQWVVSFPKRIRYFLQHEPARFRAVLRICMRAIETSVRRRCAQAPRSARVGAVLFGHQFGASLNAHHHGHLLVSDAVFSLDDGNLNVHHATEPDAQAIAKLTDTIRKRVLAHLVRSDCLDADDAKDMLAWQHHGGFSVDASVHIAACDRQGLQRVVRYCARHPFAKGRLLRLSEQKVIYQLPKPDVDGNSALSFDPLELLDQLAKLIMPPRRHRHTFWGALAPHCALRPFVVPSAPQNDSVADAPENNDIVDHQIATLGLLPTLAASARTTDGPASPGPLSSLWAIMLAKVFEVLPILCPTCGVEMKPVALILNSDSLDRICRHQGQPLGIPKLAPARDPPQGDFDFGA